MHSKNGNYHHLDALARDGAIFNKCYTICPVCGPARASMLTGMSPYVQETRTNQSVEASITPDGVCMTHQTYDEILVDNGYYAEYIGKWHSPNFHTKCYSDFPMYNYDEWLNTISPQVEPAEGQQLDNTYKRAYIPNSMDTRYGESHREDWVGKDGNVQPLIQPDSHGELLLAPEHTKGAMFVDWSIEALHKAKASGKPFTITCSIDEPHSPMILPKPYYGMYPPQNMPIPKSIDDAHDNSPYHTSNNRLEHPEYADKEKIGYMISDYYGMITQNDDNIGRLIAELKAIGEYENTLIIFTSDHGEMLGAHGMREKNVFYEESLHVPLMMILPGVIPTGTVIDIPVTNKDLHATILDYLGVGKNLSEGKSLRPQIDGTALPSDEPHVICEWSYPYMPSLCVVTDKWKLIVSVRKEDVSALYNTTEDAIEMHNLIGHNPNRNQYRTVVERLKGYLLTYLERIGHPLLEVVKYLDIV